MDAQTHFITRGRKKRSRKPGAGSAAKVKGHSRTPRGNNKGKPTVVVDGYRRGKPASKRKKKKR